MQVGDRHTIKLERVSERETINTKDFGGFNKAHQDHFGEGDRDITGKCSFYCSFAIEKTRTSLVVKVQSFVTYPIGIPTENAVCPM